jgi:alkaline phosphatase D
MPYDQATGAGSIGVEFAGTAVSSSGFGGTIASANKKSTGLVRDNKELQWSEGYYRGYYELQISPTEMTANYFGTSPASMSSTQPSNYYIGCPTVATRNPFEISLANFTVLAGANHLQRSVANGSVESGALQRGNVHMTNLTLNTESRTWNVTAFNQMFIKY